MKTKIKQSKPFHLHVEHFFRKQYCLYIMLVILAFAVVKADSRLVNMARQAYVQGFGIIGQFMREETTRVPITFDISARVPTTSAGH